MELPFAALQNLCSPFLALMERLPLPQRDALAVAFGLSAGPSPNPFLVGLAVPGLLSETAEEQPLLGVIDDAQWLDRASARALAFVARRLLAERIALVFAARTPADTTAVPELSSSRWGIATRGRYWSPCCPPPSTTPSWSGSSSRRAEIRSRSSSCRAG